jgi:hydrogenase maturation protease
MNSELVERIIQALLYEGYMLYPYRPSAIKNRQRWNFGVLTPKSFSDANQGTEAWIMQTECIVQTPKDARLNINARFLQLVSEEAVEREISLTDQSLNELTIVPRDLSFQIPAEHQVIEGSVEISSELIASEVFKLRTRVKNLTKVPAAGTRTRHEILPHSLISTHIILSVKDGEFVSLLEPPEDLRVFAGACQNVGCWPVLVGEAGERDCMLSSPIILYDYPQVAAESAGDFYDATEIDELLTLRVLTLTDEEKREMRGGDLLTRQILERTEALPREQLARVHGAVRGLVTIKEDKS